jgi:hypothetical protein
MIFKSGKAIGESFYTASATAAQVQQVGFASTIQLRAIRLETPARAQALRLLLLENHSE